MKSINHKTIHQRNPIDQSCDTKNWMNLLISIKVDNTKSACFFSVSFFFIIIVIITRANGTNYCLFSLEEKFKVGEKVRRGRKKKKEKEKNVKTKEWTKTSKLPFR